MTTRLSHPWYNLVDAIHACYNLVFSVWVVPICQVMASRTRSIDNAWADVEIFHHCISYMQHHKKKCESAIESRHWPKFP